MDSAKKTDRRAGAANALFWFAFALAVCYGATLLGIGSASEPGSGFVFFWSGLIMAILSLSVLVDSLRGVAVEGRELSHTNWPKIFIVLAALALYGFLLETVGFILTTFALVSFLLALGDETKWSTVFTLAGAAALASFAVFDLWLNIRLPRGIFGF